MVTKPRLSKGLRRHIRNQKAMIRRKFGDTPEAGAKIKELILKYRAPAPPAIPGINPRVSPQGIGGYANAKPKSKSTRSKAKKETSEEPVVRSPAALSKRV